MTWQTIESAPKDGTDIFVYRPGYIPDAAIAWWHSGWISTFTGEPLKGAPTHWMSLPAPPQIEDRLTDQQKDETP